MVGNSSIEAFRCFYPLNSGIFFPRTSIACLRDGTSTSINAFFKMGNRAKLQLLREL